MINRWQFIPRAKRHLMVVVPSGLVAQVHKPYCKLPESCQEHISDGILFSLF